MRKMYWLVALAAVALGVAAFPRASTRAVAASKNENAELARLQAALDDERMERQRDVAKLEAQLRALSVARASVSAASGSTATPAAMAAPQAAYEEPVEQVEPEVHMQRVFDDQTIDATWASATEQSLEQKVRAQLAGAQVRSVECHASLCRLETVLASKEHFGQFMSEAFKDPSKRIWAGESFSEMPVESSQGELIVVSYLAREGEPLPRTP